MELWQVVSSHLLWTIWISLMVAWFVRCIISRPQNLPPGPTGIPFLGVALKLRSDLLKLLSSWADQYGDIVSFHVGPKLIVVLNSYEAVTEAFRHPDLHNRHKSQLLKEISGSSGQNGVLFADGETWREQRKFIHSVFRRLGVGKKSYEDIVAREMDQLCDAIKEKTESSFDPSDLFGQAVANIICSIIFGTQYKYSDTEFKQILALLNKSVELSGSGGWVFLLPLPGISKIPFGRIKGIVSNVKELNIFVRTMIENHEVNFDPDHPRDFIDQYLNMLNETQGTDSTFTRLNLEGAIKDLFVAGSETTTNTLKWSILYMMAYPDVQSRVQKELDHVIGRHRFAKLADRKNLPYTNAVLMEVQRKATVAPLGVPHVAAADSVVRGFTIPKGATIISNLHKVLNRGDLWEEPDAFKPERFLNEDGKLIKREELIFFSSGHRVCLGEQLARMEYFLGFTSLLHRFTFKKSANSPPLSFAGVLGGTRKPVPYLTCAIPRD